MPKDLPEIRCPLFLIATRQQHDAASGKPVFSGFYLRVVTTREGRPAKLLPIFTSENEVRQFASRKSSIPNHAARFDTFAALCRLLDALQRNGVELVGFDLGASQSDAEAPHVNIEDVIRDFSARPSQ
jgi:hypothetical protein